MVLIERLAVYRACVKHLHKQAMTTRRTTRSTSNPPTPDVETQKRKRTKGDKGKGKEKEKEKEKQRKLEYNAVDGPDEQRRAKELTRGGGAAGKKGRGGKSTKDKDVAATESESDSTSSDSESEVETMELLEFVKENLSKSKIETKMKKAVSWGSESKGPRALVVPKSAIDCGKEAVWIIAQVLAPELGVTVKADAAQELAESYDQSQTGKQKKTFGQVVKSVFYKEQSRVINVLRVCLKNAVGFPCLFLCTSTSLVIVAKN